VKTLQLYQFEPVVTVLGPGRRAAVWVQGCPFRCPGCCAPDSQPDSGGTVITSAQLAQRICDSAMDCLIEGISISGGEPFQQAEGLTEVLNLVHAQHPQLTVMIYSGFALGVLRSFNRPGISGLLQKADVLIDGVFLRDQPTTNPWKGSENQTIHFLTGRIEPADVNRSHRHIELFRREDRLFAAGIPTSFSSRLS